MIKSWPSICSDYVIAGDVKKCVCAAIVAMRRAHKLELEKSRHMQHVKENADLMQLQVEHE